MRLRLLLPLFGFAFIIGQVLAAPVELVVGKEFRLGTNILHVTEVSMLPLVESEFTRLFRFDSAQNPKLKLLRRQYELDSVLAKGKGEFGQQLLLMDWVHHRFQKFGQPTRAARGALEILDGIEAGETFFCTQYAQLFASAAASMGWVDRVLALRRHQDAGSEGSTEHSTTEIWSNQHRKWVMLDPTSNMYLERGGVPLNAFEIRQEWFYSGGSNLTFVVGKERRRYTKADLPIRLRTFPGFGDLEIGRRELDKYGFIGYIPNTDLMDAGFDYGGMFITQDELCAGTQWHKRRVPKDPAADPYFPIGQAAFRLETSGEVVEVEIRTLTPNLKRIEARMDQRGWQSVESRFVWMPASKWKSVLELRTVNEFGVYGPVSRVVLEVKKSL